jgi:hypothetical protein
MKGPRRLKLSIKKTNYEKKLMLLGSGNSSNEINELSSKSLLANVLDINDDLIGNNKKNGFRNVSNKLKTKFLNDEMNNFNKIANGNGVIGNQSHSAYLRRENSNLSQSGTDSSQFGDSYFSKPDVLRKNLGSILKELRLITQKLKDDEEDEGKSLDWKFAAMVIDRLCMVVFAVATLLSAILILFTSKNIFKPSDPHISF